jgi:hypothetical protein
MSGSSGRHVALMQRALVSLQVFLLVAMLVTPAAALAVEPSGEPSAAPSAEPTAAPSPEPTVEPTSEPTAEPTAEPTTEPTAEPTGEPTAEPTVEPTAEPSAVLVVTPEPTSIYAPSGPPSIRSDEADYPPGGTVTLAGSNWRAGENVQIFVNDDTGASWSLRADLVANDSGEISYSFALPDWFVATYRVTATGAESGTATTSFTDANMRFLSSGPTLASIGWALFSDSTCTNPLSGPATSGNGSITTTDSTSGTLNVAAVSNQFVRLTAPSTAGGQSFGTWTATSGGGAFTTSDGGRTICAAGDNSSGLRRFTASYVAGNTAPVSAAQTVLATEETPKVITLSGTDANGESLSFSILSGPSSGTLGTLSEPTCSVAAGTSTCTASVTYTPSPDFNGPDAFSFRVNDGVAFSASAVVSINVVAVDDNPVAVDDTKTVLEDAAATTIDVLANDTDIDAGPKTISSASDPANGTVVVAADGLGLTYQPDADYCNNPPGTTLDTFTYTLNGGSTATVRVTVTCVNDAPVVVVSGDFTEVDEGVTRTYTYTVADVDSTNPIVTESCTGDASYIADGTANSFKCQFLDGPGSGIVTIEADDGSSINNVGSDTHQVTVNNVAPTVVISGATSVDEGSAEVAYSFTVSDPGQDGFTVTGDPSCGTGGAYVPASLGTTATGGSFKCTFPDGPASPLLSITVNDGDDAGSDTHQVTVNNVAPTVSAAAITVDPVTGIISASMTYADAGALDTQTATFEYRLDGVLQVTNNTASNLPSSGTATDSYDADPGCYSIEVTMWVTDKDGASSIKVVRNGATSEVDIYTPSFKAPIKGDERNIAKYGNVVPVKVELASSCFVGTTVTTPILHITIATGDDNMDPLAIEEIPATSVSNADTGTQMRVSGGGYIYNLSTKSMKVGQEYTIRIRVGSAAGPVILRALFQPKK